MYINNNTWLEVLTRYLNGCSNLQNCPFNSDSSVTHNKDRRITTVEDVFN